MDIAPEPDVAPIPEPTVVVGTLARMAFGPVGFLVVAADSYSKSVSGKSLLEQIRGVRKGTP